MVNVVNSLVAKPANLLSGLVMFKNISIYLIFMDYTKIIKQWNPWWVFKKVELNKYKIEREKTKEIINFLKVREVIILKGIRRSGKSTIIYQIVNFLINNKVNPKNIFYFNFDQPLDNNNIEIMDSLLNNYLEENNPKGKIYFFLDEIQNIDSWEKWIKKEYDLKEKRIKFIITGSNNSLLSNKIATVLTGRTISIDIFPLYFLEYLLFNNYKYYDLDLDSNKVKYHLNHFLKKGGFPEVVLEKDEYINKKRLLEYFENILLRDIITIREIKETKKLKELAHYLITNNSSQITYSKLSQIFGLSKSTIKEYISYIDQSFLISEVNFYSYSLKKSIGIQKPKKIYCIDNGLREAVSFKFWDDNSKLVENLVYVDLLRRGLDIYYWFSKNEIDFVVSKNNKLTLINVCYSDKIPDRELKGFFEFEKEYKNIDKKIIITKNIDKKEGGVFYIPLYKWLLKENFI